jgi:isoamylase
VWLTPAGEAMTPADWGSGFGRSVGVFLNGRGIRSVNSRGQRVIDDSFVLLFSAHDEPLEFTLPPDEYAHSWLPVIDTAGLPEQLEVVKAGDPVTVAGKAVVVLRAYTPEVPSSSPSEPAAAAVPSVPSPPSPSSSAVHVSTPTEAEAQAQAAAGDDVAGAEEPVTPKPRTRSKRKTGPGRSNDR